MSYLTKSAHHCFGLVSATASGDVQRPAPLIKISGIPTLDLIVSSATLTLSSEEVSVGIVKTVRLGLMLNNSCLAASSFLAVRLIITIFEALAFANAKEMAYKKVRSSCRRTCLGKWID